MEFPGELNLISVFESIPERKDRTDDFNNDKSKFSFENDHESFEVIISPFYQEFALSVKDKKTTNVLSYIEFRSVKKLEIVEDRKNCSKIRLIHGETERFENIIEITLKPRYKFIFREQYR
ncbi:hypothetical protein [Guptibacillus hwajinpoensis]|uniref:Uncharacterized protein n=1 Tax=Guptibacillus hwajinpoensis TaxID=208199 RepID=A0A0J6CZE6_9BACL|nr:hypothetical protein [Alkalihalobacillus macyae]KMM38485.1 hypothetical protein AB986_04085 [Alkalihalobacillus macyae]